MDGVWDLPYTGWHIEGDLPNQVAVNTGSTVMTCSHHATIVIIFTSVIIRKSLVVCREETVGSPVRLSFTIMNL